ncbi:MAG: hypothetical protein IPH35_00800 [Rhodoferax sp.]|nr:hypothetical protein [Rhodoferax sp.]
MQAIRQFYEDAPSAIVIPESMQHRRLVVIFQIEESDESESREDLKSLLMAMPDVGEDADFARRLDYGREGVAQTIHLGRRSIVLN